MDMIFFNQIAKSNASTLSRTGIRDFVVQHPMYMNDLVAIATDLTNKNHYKAIWIIEMLAETNAEMVAPYMDVICKTTAKYKHESAIRGMSRTAYYMSIAKVVTLTESQKEKLIEICLDWLIGDAKVAPKAYAMYTLCHFTKQEPWLKEELRTIIDKDYYHQSAGYKAAAKEVLRKINR